MRGERREGRFSIQHERGSIISGTTKEVVRTVGYEVEWWLYDQDLTVVDPIYDVGSNSGGRRWHGPHHIPVVNAALFQGVTVQGERGFYNTDVLRVTINMDIVDGSSLSGGESRTIPELKYLPTNPDAYLRDRIVFRNQVFTVKQIFPKGIITDDYTLFTIDCNQVNPEELVNDPQFQSYANYTPFVSKDGRDIEVIHNAL
jgi:hypothetical protein